MYVEVTRYVLCSKKHITDMYIHMYRSFIQDFTVKIMFLERRLQKDQISGFVFFSLNVSLVPLEISLKITHRRRL